MTETMMVAILAGMLACLFIKICLLVLYKVILE